MKKTPRQAAGTGERGFSLIELLIAMAVTVIVSGAVLMLLVQANQSFQTQPEMTERQQNVRAGMDLIMRDVANAGAGLPQGVQVFRQLLDGVDPAAPSGEPIDRLEMLTNETGRDPLPTTGAPGVLQILPQNTGVAVGTPVLLLMSDPANPYVIRTVDSVDQPAAPGVQQILTLDVPVAAAEVVRQIYFVNRVLYYIAPDPAEPVLAGTLPTPILWRQVNGAPGVVDPNAAVQQVARGIENMQVRYRAARDITANPTAPCPDAECDLPLTQPEVWDAVAGLNALTVEVQVRLDARGGLVVPDGQGATAAMLRRAPQVGGFAPDDTLAYRGSLRSRGAPRAALMLAGGDGRWQ